MMKMMETRCAAAPLPSRGGARGGVCNLFAIKKIQTPPRPTATPPLERRGAGYAIARYSIATFKMDSSFKFEVLNFLNSLFTVPAKVYKNSFYSVYSV